MAWLQRYLTEGRPKLSRSIAERAVFLNRRGTRLSRKGMWKRFHELTQAVGIDAKVHTLRHSFATPSIWIRVVSGTVWKCNEYI